MCCCCPPAITALFCLWVRSGFSKDSVAGALTFFPPDPALYKFQRVGSDGEMLPDEPEPGKEEEEDEEEVDEDNDEVELMEVREDELEDDDDFSEDCTGTNGKNPPPAQGQTANGSSNSGNAAEESSKPKAKKKKEEKPKSPAKVLTERSRALRRRAKHRNAIDARDAANSVTYLFLPDERLPPAPPATGTVEALKIGPQKKTKSYIATLIYRVRSDRLTENTKTILYSHGNATDVGAMHLIQSILCRSLNANVVVYDYSGYGESGGIPMESNTYRDVKLVYDHTVRHVASGTEKNVVVYGQSVGSGPSCYLCSKRQNVGGLVLHSPFTSGMRVLTPSRALACLDIFPNIDRISHVNCPVMVIHGQLDEEVDIAHGLALYNAVRDDLKRDPWWVPDRGHNDITDGPGKMSEYVRRLKVFLDSLDS